MRDSYTDVDVIELASAAPKQPQAWRLFPFKQNMVVVGCFGGRFVGFMRDVVWQLSS